jgi:hypothetical protein
MTRRAKPKPKSRQRKPPSAPPPEASGNSTATLPSVLQEAINKFSAWSQQHLQAEQDASAITMPLYHYTDGGGLKGLLASGRLWFTDYRHLNDPSELTHGIDMARDVARGLGNAATGADAPKGLFLEHFTDLFRHDNFASTLEFFIASFSRARDDLGQWRAYADNGRGFAIGLAQRMFRVTELTPGSLPEFVGPVRYRIEEVWSRHGAALEQAITIFADTLRVNAELMRNTTVAIPFMDRLVREIIARPLMWNCLTSKHPAYEHEQEVRLLIMGTPQRLSPYITTRLRGSEIVPYIPHQMPLREPNHIAEIVVGPAAPADAERTVRTMLTSLGLDPNIAVGRSDIPYRAM